MVRTNEDEAHRTEEFHQIPSELHTSRLEVSRLVVLVPETGVYGVELAQRILDLATPCELKVLFLCAATPDPSRESTVYLRLITLASQISSDQVDAKARVEPQLTWVQAVRQHWQPGDIIICCAEQTVQTQTGSRQPLWTVLEHSLEVPVFVLPNLYTEEPTKASTNYWGIMRWVVPLVLIAVFFYAEFKISNLSASLTHTLLMIAVALAEVGLLAGWSLFT